MEAMFNLLGPVSKERENARSNCRRHVKSRQYGSQYAMVNDIKGIRKINK